MDQQKSNNTLVILAIAGFICYFFINFISNTNSDMPADFKPDISKDQAAAIAANFIQTDLEEHKTLDTFVSFQTHKTLAGYLNKNNLLADYNQSFNDTFPLDYFQVELTEAQGQKRFLVHIHMKSGQIIGWNNILSPTSVPQSDPYFTAEKYLQSKGYNQADFTLISDKHGSEDTFIFESKKNLIGELALQLHISVHDGQVSSFHPQFNIPESYMTWLEEQDTSTSQMTWISLSLSIAMLITAIVLTILYRKEVTFKRGILLTTVFMITYSFHNLNMIPAYKGMFAGETNQELLIFTNMIILTLTTLVMGITVYFSLISGEALWRRKGKHLWPRWNESTFGRQVIQAMGTGYLFCLIILGFQTIVFSVGEHFFDVWSINDPLFSNHNLWMPMLFPILAWAAAISEEAIYRLFGIIIFKKIVKNTFLAVLIPSMIWALGHVQYPIYPVYTRFIEVTILGLIFGYIFLKHGFITAIFTHISVNSLLMGLSIMVIPGGAANSLMALFFIATPAITAYAIYFMHSMFRRSDPPSNPLSIHPQEKK